MVDTHYTHTHRGKRFISNWLLTTTTTYGDVIRKERERESNYKLDRTVMKIERESEAYTVQKAPPLNNNTGKRDSERILGNRVQLMKY